MERKELDEVFRLHVLWLAGNTEGKRADLRYTTLSYANLSEADLSEADLIGADLSEADLSGAKLIGANLSEADLSGAKLIGANLRGAKLIGADLREADLREASLRGADLCGANLSGANLSGADLSGAMVTNVRYNEHTSFFALQCPEEGSFIGWKKCKDDVIVKLLIPEDAKRSSATSRKCRASKAIVLDVFGAEYGITSRGFMNTLYEKGATVLPDSFDEDRWNECSHGIHFFITCKEAENYN